MKKRLRFDIFMTCLLAFEMFFELTGDALHEIIGFIFFVSIAVHLALSAKWARSVTRAMGAGRASRRSIVRAIYAIVLLSMFVPLVASSIAISQLLYGAGLELAFLFSYGTWAVIHEFTAYAVCALTVVHLAMHWKNFAHTWHVPYDPQRRAAIGTCVGVAAGIGAIALGVAGTRVLDAFSLPAESTSSTATNESALSVNDKTAPSAPSTSSSASSTESTSEKSSGTSSAGETKSTPSSPSSDFGSASSSNDSSSSSSGSTVSGTCPLCSKHCPLSAPRCDRPYREGLI